jgi:hypothetical protein
MTAILWQGESSEREARRAEKGRAMKSRGFSVTIRAVQEHPQYMDARCVDLIPDVQEKGPRRLPWRLMSGFSS